jgi:hypothetical protein
MVHRSWQAFTSPRHELAFGVLVVGLRVLAVMGPLLLLALAMSIAGGGSDS